MAQRGRSTGRQPGRPASTGRPQRTAPPPLPAATTAQIAAVRDVAEAAIVAAGYELEALSVKAVGRRHLVRVIIDGDGGLGLDVIADVSRAVSQALDAAEESGRQLIAGEYQLEVSSPGVDRPLTLPKHWRRNTGRTVKVKAGDRQLTGRITSASDDEVTLDVEGVAHKVGYADLGAGRVQIEFSRLDEVSDEDLQEFEDEEER
ncbi:ribosome maturation factor RimP [Catelliglobosispora koreensis]|uniref:ribosome maturation factor RimP n=1 Tax=Catelliglobosispora koreensis TaxID=129052 RepID=UPI0004780500|nr:ribosome maturation factor RimP [Catelliglobosispora koreensis]